MIRSKLSTRQPRIYELYQGILLCFHGIFKVHIRVLATVLST